MGYTNDKDLTIKDLTNKLTGKPAALCAPSIQTYSARRYDAPSIDTILAERGKTYGDFKDGAEIIQQLKSIAHGTENWYGMEALQREALDMIFSKIGRILNGDPNHTDSWHDIIGYAKLVEDRLNGNSK